MSYNANPNEIDKNRLDATEIRIADEHKKNNPDSTLGLRQNRDNNPQLGNNPGPTIKQHPDLMNQPEGVAPKLSSNAYDNANTADELINRADESSAELEQLVNANQLSLADKYELQQKLANQKAKKFSPKPGFQSIG